MTAPASLLVHVAGNDGRCRPALVLEPGERLTRVRVFVASAINDPGSLDYEGDVPHCTEPIIVPTPDEYGGGFRALESWHSDGTCDGSRALVAGLVEERAESVVGSDHA